MVVVYCQQCGKEFLAKRRSAKFCSSLRRQYTWRGHPSVEFVVVGSKAAHHRRSGCNATDFPDVLR